MPALAEDAAVQEAAIRVADCVNTRDADACRSEITANSARMFERFVSYNLMDCLPQHATFVSSKPDGAMMRVRATVMMGDKESTVRLIFQQEKGQWKLDIPETLHQGLGANWQNQLDATEQLYLMLRSQMGDTLNCEMVTKLGSGMASKH